jgi:hypothetical protein
MQNAASDNSDPELLNQSSIDNQQDSKTNLNDVYMEDLSKEGGN